VSTTSVKNSTGRTTSTAVSVPSAQVAGSPVQYMAGMVGPLWLTVGAAGLFASERTS
jgi:hypothetical protein